MLTSNSEHNNEKYVAPKFDLDNIQPSAQHFDLIVSPKRLLCWAFELRRLIEAHGDVYGAEVFKSILEGLKQLSESENKRTRRCHFALWGGDYLGSFSVGVPTSLNAEVMEILGLHLRRVTGYYTQEFGYTASLPFSPLFTYDAGRVIEYSDDSVAGQEYPDAYGSGVTVNYRLIW